MNYYWSLLFKAFKVGITFNIITLILAAIYVFCVEVYFQPFKLKSVPVIELGTAVSGMKIFSTANPRNHGLRPAWAKIESECDLFLPEFQLRPD
jgi:uncharacterized integral membrane protein